LLQAIAEQIKLFAVLTGRRHLVHLDEVQEHIRVE
jgi:hypothetical protein